MKQEMGQTDKQILNELQFNFPITEKPFLEIANRIGISQEEILKRIKDLKDNKIIRRIGPTFEGSKLGYVNTLIAMKVPESKLDEIGQFVSSYDEVTHDYSRDNEYNLWFTLTCKDDQRLNEILSEIKERTGQNAIFSLPAVRKFKINARFKL